MWYSAVRGPSTHAPVGLGVWRSSKKIQGSSLVDKRGSHAGNPHLGGTRDIGFLPFVSLLWEVRSSLAFYRNGKFFGIGKCQSKEIGTSRKKPIELLTSRSKPSKPDSQPRAVHTGSVVRLRKVWILLHFWRIRFFCTAWKMEACIAETHCPGYNLIRNKCSDCTR